MSGGLANPDLAQAPVPASGDPVTENDLKPLFFRILDIIKSRKFFDEAPTFFVVYAWDNGGQEAGSDVVVEFIEACQRAGCCITSDQDPAARVVTEEQLCLLPFGLHKNSVELVVLCGSNLLGGYMKDDKVQRFIQEMAECYAKAEGDTAKRKAVLEVYEKYSGDRDFHHVYTEMALLNIRSEFYERNSIIPFLLNGNHEENFPTYLTQHKNILRTVLGPKPAGDGSKYECFLQILEKFADRRTRGPGSAHLIQSLRKIFSRAVDELRSQSFMTKSELEAFLLSHRDKANDASDEWSNSQWLPSTAGINNYQIEGRSTRRLKVLKTLRSAYRDGKDRNPQRVQGTCEWFVSHRFFQQWQKSGVSSMLWVSADPGCGKSVLAKHLVDDVLPSNETRKTCYFFFKEDYEDQRSAVSALCCLLHQLFEQNDSLLSDKVIEKFETSGERLTTSVSELWKLLINASRERSAGEILCVLDAFDECDDQGQLDITQALVSFYGAENHNKLKFLITSRPYGSIRRGFQPLDMPGLPVIHLSGESEEEMKKIASEIDIFIEARVRSIRAILKLKPEEEQLLRKELLNIPNRTYLWVHLTLDLVQKAVNIDAKGISEVASHLPRNVNEAYDKILSKTDDVDEAKKLLHIVVVATRPLTLKEMSFALTIRENNHGYKDIDLKSEDRFAEYVRDLCGLFVTIQSQKIYLLHQTAKEFLVWKDYPNSENGPIPNLKWKSLLVPQESHRVLAEICLWHLLFAEFDTEPLTTSNVTQYVLDHIFLDYSAKNWATHFRTSGIADDETIKSLLRICDASSRRCQTWFNIFWESTYGSSPQRFTTVMIASYFGLERVVTALLNEKGVVLNSVDGVHCRSALSWASQNGFSNVVGLLIKGPKIYLRDFARLRFWKGAEVNAKDKYGRTPLSYAAWSGHMDVVQQLIKAGAQADLADDIGGTPMSYALLSGQNRILELMLTKIRKTSLDDSISGDLLLSAAQKGHTDVVKLLLDSGKVNPNLKDTSGRTSLSLAAENSHDAVVELLLSCNNVDVNSRDLSGRTPLSWATGSAVAHMLLEFSKIDADCKDDSGRTPLSWAAQAGHRAVVTALLENNQVDADGRDNFGRTPLSWAAQHSDSSIAEVLLRHSQVDVESKDLSGRTPLSWATENEDTSILKMLLEHSKVNADSRDNSGRTPLSWAAERGIDTVMEILIGHDQINVESKDESGRTPLSWIAENVEAGLVSRPLLGRRDIYPDLEDQSGRTPLSWAAEKGKTDLVEALLISGRADPNSRDISGQTPLAWAFRKTQWDVVKQIVDFRGTDVTSNGKTKGLIILENKLDETLSVREVGNDSLMTLGKGEINAMHQSTEKKQLCLCYPGPGNQWTSPFTGDTGFTHVKIAKAGRRQHLIRVDVSLLEDVGAFIQLSPEKEAWPFLIRNESHVEFIFWQSNPQLNGDDSFRPIRFRLPPRSIMPYSWDYTTAKNKELVLSAQGVERNVKLDEPGSLVPLRVNSPSGSGERTVIDIAVVADGPSMTLVLSTFKPGRVAKQSKR